jgi:hypothetical protein
MNRPHFSIQLLLLLAAIFAIAFGGITGWVRVESRTAPVDLAFIAATIGMTAPLRMPIVSWHMLLDDGPFRFGSSLPSECP